MNALMARNDSERSGKKSLGGGDCPIERMKKELHMITHSTTVHHVGRKIIAGKAQK